MLRIIASNKIIHIPVLFILAYLLGITFGWLVSILIIGLIIAYYLPNQKYLILLAAFLLLILPLVWWWSEDWAAYLGDAIFCLLLFYLILNISDIKIPANIFENLPITKLFPYTIYLSIITFFIFLSFGIFQTYQKLINSKSSLEITLLNEPQPNQTLSTQIVNTNQSGKLLLNLIKPDQKIQSYQININNSTTSFDIPASDLKEAGSYELIASSTNVSDQINFQIND